MRASFAIFCSLVGIVANKLVKKGKKHDKKATEQQYRMLATGFSKGFRKIETLGFTRTRP